MYHLVNSFALHKKDEYYISLSCGWYAEGALQDMKATRTSFEIRDAESVDFGTSGA